MNITHDKDLFKACHILFGSEVDVSYDFLHYIQASGIKSAYRKKALLTHPDHNRESTCTEAFVEANWAYESLSKFITLREDIPRHRPIHGTRATTRRPNMRRRSQRYRNNNNNPTGNYYKGRVPSRKLMIGEYLFYNGSIPWEALIKAIVWQRNQRPRLGEIARQWGWLTREQGKKIIKERNLGEPVGETLVRTGILNRTQLRTLISSQRKSQKPFGEFFVINGYLSRKNLFQNLTTMEMHNSKIL
ncbi:DnaJ domain-containing protein [Nitrospirota bacterium]